MPKCYLTDELVRSAVCPDDKDQDIIFDFNRDISGKRQLGSQEGLGLRVTRNGRKAFIHTYLWKNKRRRKVIGRPPEMTVAAARLCIQQRLQSIVDCLDPDAPVVVAEAQPIRTVGDLAEAFYEQHLRTMSVPHRAEFRRKIAPWIAPDREPTKTGRKARQQVPAFGAIFKEVPIERVTPQHIGQFLTAIENDHHANGALTQIKAMFNWAIRMQIVDMRNPCTPFRKRKILKQRREYTPENVHDIALHIFNPPMLEVVQLSDLSGDAKRIAALKAGKAAQRHQCMTELCNFMGILLLTMARPKELKLAEFGHFDLERLIWHKHNTKGIQLSRQSYEFTYRSIPIHAKVAEIIHRQRNRWPNSRFVFPSHTDMDKSRDNFAHALQAFKQLDGVPAHFQMYDLKRMAISLMMVGQGVRREDVSHYVDHKGNLETTLIYDLGFVDPLRPVTDRLGELLGI